MNMTWKSKSGVVFGCKLPQNDSKIVFRQIFSRLHRVFQFMYEKEKRKICCIFALAAPYSQLLNYYQKYCNIFDTVVDII
jgi:hypothetical protein